MSGWQLLPMAVRGSSSRPFFKHPQGPFSSPPSPVPTPRDQIAPLSCLTCLYLANLTFSRWAWRCLLRALKYAWALPALRRLAVSGEADGCSRLWSKAGRAEQWALTVVGGGGRRPAVSPVPSWGLQPHSVLKASLRAFSSFPIAQTELRAIRKVPQLPRGSPALSLACASASLLGSSLLPSRALPPTSGRQDLQSSGLGCPAGPRKSKVHRELSSLSEEAIRAGVPWGHGWGCLQASPSCRLCWWTF